VMEKKTTLAQDCKSFNSTFWLHVNHSQLLKGNNIYYVVLYLCFWSSEVKYVNAICTSAKNTSLLIGGSSTHKTSAGARTCLEIFESSWRLSDIVRCPTGHCTVPGRSPLESCYLNFKQKSSGARPMCANAGRAPSGHRTM